MIKKTKKEKKDKNGLCLHYVRPCAFFSMFLVTFFSPNLRGRPEKKTKCPKKKKTLAQCPQTT